MNKIYISREVRVDNDESTLFLNYSNANRMLTALRSEHFIAVTLDDTQGLTQKDLKFIMQLTRLLKKQGYVHVLGSTNQTLNNVIKTIGLFQHNVAENVVRFLRSAPVEVVEKKQDKLAIGFHANEQEQQIDQSELLEGEGIKVDKKKVQNCDVKPRACANCNCGRKDNEKTVSKQELVQAVNEGKPVSGCGKCLLGDSFRCGTCPYKGLPAFKPGDKLKLEDNGGVSVESAATFVSVGGKVKLQL